MVIPTKYVDELQNLPGEILSSSKAVYAVRRHCCSTFIDIVRLLVGLDTGFLILLKPEPCRRLFGALHDARGQPPFNNSPVPADPIHPQIGFHYGERNTQGTALNCSRVRRYAAAEEVV